MTKFRITLISAFYLLISYGFGQDKAEIKLTGFLDTYYAWDFNQPPGGRQRQSFFFNHNRHNEFNVNLALLRMEISHERYRAVVGLQGGTYAVDNYAAEDNMLSHLFEAYAGLALNQESTLWLDAGVFASHLGFENAISLDNYTLTRSLVAENSPYFLSGARLTYEPSAQWTFLGVICNGWQRIGRFPDNSLPGFGTQVMFSPTSALSINWSTFVGSDDPDDARRMRYFNNLYATASFGENFNLIVGLDHGLQENIIDANGYDSWLGATIIGHYQWSDTWAVGVRGEYYNDPAGVIIDPEFNPGQSPSPLLPDFGFSTGGLSLNLDFTPVEDVAWRIEGRWLNDQNPIYVDYNQGELSGTNFFLVSSLAIRFGKNW